MKVAKCIEKFGSRNWHQFHFLQGLTFLSFRRSIALHTLGKSYALIERCQRVTDALHRPECRVHHDYDDDDVALAAVLTILLYTCDRVDNSNREDDSFAASVWRPGQEGLDSRQPALSPSSPCPPPPASVAAVATAPAAASRHSPAGNERTNDQVCLYSSVHRRVLPSFFHAALDPILFASLANIIELAFSYTAVRTSAIDVQKSWL